MSLPISGFTAVPNPQMLAFMAAQSFIMMFQAGEGWQYGKRRQSAMSNEEFNKQSPNSIMERQLTELKTALPTIERSMDAMTPMIRTIVTQYGDFVAEIIKAAPEVLQAAQGGQTLPDNIMTVAKELRDIISNLIPKLPEANATLYTYNTNPSSPPPPPSADQFAHTLGTHAGHTVGNIPTTQGPTEGPSERKDLEQNQPSSKVLSAAEDPIYIAWITKLGKLKAQFQSASKQYNRSKSTYSGSGPLNRAHNQHNRYIKARSQALSLKRDATSKIRQMSNQYRDPNNHIRENALRLRQAMANGQWK